MAVSPAASAMFAASAPMATVVASVSRISVSPDAALASMA